MWAVRGIVTSSMRSSLYLLASVRGGLPSNPGEDLPLLAWVLSVALNEFFLSLLHPHRRSEAVVPPIKNRFESEPLRRWAGSVSTRFFL